MARVPECPKMTPMFMAREHGPWTRVVCTGHNDKSCREQKYCGIFFLDTCSQSVRYNCTEYKHDIDYCTVYSARRTVRMPISGRIRGHTVYGETLQKLIVRNSSV